MRPRDAATLIILRNRREVLLGCRAAGHIFMPHRYVFPGGRVDAGDARVSAPFSLNPQTSQLLRQSLSPARARALAMAAVRETFEETGLILGRPVERTISTRSSHWQPFYNTGMAPALDQLEYFARAVTPPNRVRRFDARFFVVDERHISGELRGNGELEDLQWVDLEEVDNFKLASITRLILLLLRRDLTGSADLPLIQKLKDREKFEHHGLSL
jgi:8-oxo-dGTP pyrophosphatase MutT (NUDIX family)